MKWPTGPLVLIIVGAFVAVSVALLPLLALAAMVVLGILSELL